MLTRPSCASDRRRGVALLVVVSLLALFAVVGLAFLLYAESEASASRIYREAQTPPQIPDIPPALLLNVALNQLIYDTPDDASAPGGAYSALRGHSLGRNMYGWYYTQDKQTGKVDYNSVNNFAPFNGLGRMHTDPGPGGPVGLSVVLPADGSTPADEYNLVNYTFFRNDKWVRDPERYSAAPTNFRASPLQLFDPTKQIYFGGFNPPYSFPDANLMALGAISMGDPQTGNQDKVRGTSIPMGSILTQSFHRRSLFGDLYNANSANHFDNPNWKNQVGKYLTLRPRPVDHTPAFPYPVSPGGDVQNLPGGPGYYDPNTGTTFAEDSVWIDLGYPAQQTRNGQWFKPLFAFLILDLDNRVNVNVHGNVRITPTGAGAFAGHASQFGIGKHEVNLSTVLDLTPLPPANSPEWQNLFTGNPTMTTAFGRYGASGQPGPAYYDQPPNGPPTLLPGYQQYKWTYGALPLYSLLGHGTNSAPGQYSNAPYYSLVNYDAAHGSPTGNGITWVAAQPFTFPAKNEYNFFPTFAPNTGYLTGDPNPQSPPGGTQDDRGLNPLLNNPLNTHFGNIVFNRDDMRFLIGRFNQFQNPEFQQATSLINLIPNNLNDNVVAPGTNLEYTQQTQPARRNRNLITTTSFDVDRPGVTPWWWIPENDGATQYALGLPAGSEFPVGQPIPFSMSNVVNNVQRSEFNPADYRAISAQKFDRVDLTRRLVPYPAPDATTHVINLTNTQTLKQFQAAEASRVTMARDLFFRLIYATGANPDITPLSGPTDPRAPQYDALRWLAQVAVNMVDYIDEDDYSTPFDWNNQIWTYLLNNAQAMTYPVEHVYGTERPRLVINEAYSEIQNDPSDTMLSSSGKMSPNKKLKCAFWVELYNPLNQDDNGLANSAKGAAVLQVTSGSTTTPVYQLVIATSDANTMTNVLNNTTGEPATNPTNNIKLQIREWTGIPGGVIQTQGANTLPSGPNYCILAPDRNDATPGSKLDFQKTPPSTNYTENDSQLSQGQPTATFHAVPDKGGPAPGGTAPQALVYEVDPPGGAPWSGKHDVLLQRLACPAIPFNQPGKPGYDAAKPLNPFITVDFVSELPTWSAIQANNSNPNTGGSAFPAPFGPYVDLTSRAASGRIHPFIASNPVLQGPDALSPTPAGQPQNTLGKANYKLIGSQSDPSDTPPWLVHLDRKPISVPEMLNVSAYRPHLLTQKFNKSNASSTTASVSPHTIPWQSQLTRMYRALEFLTVRDRTVEMAAGARVPGKVNLNTIWDNKIIDAVTDITSPPNPNAANFFVTNTATPGTPQFMGGPATGSFYETFRAARSPSGRLNGMATGTKNDLPFLSFAAPFSPNTDPQWGAAVGWVDPTNTANPFVSDLEKTIERTYQLPRPSSTTRARLFDVPYARSPSSGSNHVEEWLKQELFTKVSNTVTNRSNVFAVYLTVGFFEVTPEFDSTGNPLRPEKLGEEVGSTARTGGPNKVLRHRMFALVDRTNLSLDPKKIASQGGDPTTNSPNWAPFYYPAKTLQLQDPTQPLAAQNANKAFTPYDNPLIDLEVPRSSNDAAQQGYISQQQGGAYTAWIPALPGSGTGGLQGTYDGFAWTIKPKDKLVLGNGDAQKIVDVVAVDYDKDYSQMGLVSFIVPDRFDVNNQKLPFLPLGAGFVISNVLPGNPGPQTTFDYTSSQYRPVVPVTAILQ